MIFHFLVFYIRGAAIVHGYLLRAFHTLFAHNEFPNTWAQ